VVGYKRGISVGGQARIVGNTVEDSTLWDGIRGFDACVIADNIVTRAADTGIKAGRDSLVTGNVVTHCKGSAILVTNLGTRIERNYCSSNGGYGLEVAASYTSGAVYMDNTFRGNAAGGVFIPSGRPSFNLGGNTCDYDLCD
jgi:hypothetical protein